MKSVFTLLLLISSTSLSAQALDQVMRTFGQGDATKVANWIERDIEVSIFSDTDFCTKSEAVAKLNKFFSNYPPRSVTEVHRGSSKNLDSQFIIAHLQTDKGKYRVYLYGVQQQKSFILQEIRVEKE